jgi:hypothetical protein
MLDRVEAGAWSLPSTFTATGVHHGYRRIDLVSSGHTQPAAAAWLDVLDQFAPVWASWLSWIDPGGFIRPHVDAGPWRERWQVPIRVSGVFVADGEPVDQQPGVPFQVEHWRRHEVGVDAASPRVHLVIDRDRLLDRPAEPFTLF